mmetsp:Transcript_35955/g.103341  ORF Transcript_35955/g.103341 Transcript_35955/m.103341 type:complete len:251 (-) Transcript_35955:3-755(-)
MREADHDLLQVADRGVAWDRDHALDLRLRVAQRHLHRLRLLVLRVLVGQVLGLLLEDAAEGPVLRRELPRGEAAGAAAAHVRPAVQQEPAQVAVPQHRRLHEGSGVLSVAYVCLRAGLHQRSHHGQPALISSPGHLSHQQEQRRLAQGVRRVRVGLCVHQHPDGLEHRRAVQVHRRRHDAEVEEAVAVGVLDAQKRADLLPVRLVRGEDLAQPLGIVSLHRLNQSLRFGALGLVRRAAASLPAVPSATCT